MCDEFDRLTHSTRGGGLVASASRGYYLGGPAVTADAAGRLARDLLADPLTEVVEVKPGGTPPARPAVTVLFKPGVMDPAADSVRAAAADLGVAVETVATFRRYYAGHDADTTGADVTLLRVKILSNPAVEQLADGGVTAGHLGGGQPHPFRKVDVPLAGLTPDELDALSRRGQLALSRAEMRAVQAHFASAGRDPTDCELETVAQTWSEHCSHKTLEGHHRLHRNRRRRDDDAPLRQHAEGDDFRRHADHSRPSRAGRLVRQRVRRQRRGGRGSRPTFTSASRSRRTTGRVRSSLTAGRTRVSAG